MKNYIEILKKITDIDQSISGLDYLKIFVKNIAKELDVKYVFIGHSVGNCCNQVQTDMVWANDDYFENFLYDLKDTPCEIVLSGQRVCIHESNVSNLFSKDKLLKEMGVESYVGAPVSSDRKKGISGLLVLLDDKPMDDSDFFKSITEFLALRASTEIEKYRIEDNLIRQVAERTLELEEANKEIEIINASLEKRVKEEISKNEDKQRIISEQSKMAIMGEMIENIAHQWRQPLSTISAISSGIKLKKELELLNDKEFYESMDIITDTTKYLSQTITDFKDFFGHNEEQEVFKLASVVNKTLKLMSSKFKNNEIEVISNIGDIEIQGNSNEFIQVFMNILSNANDEFNVVEKDKRKLLFIGIYKDEKNKIVVKIRDNAGGVQEDIIDSIFEHYVTTKKDSHGTGIGLYMTKEIVEKRLKGSIEVNNINFEYENKSYAGAEFLIKL